MNVTISTLSPMNAQVRDSGRSSEFDGIRDGFTLKFGQNLLFNDTSVLPLHATQNPVSRNGIT